MRSDLSCQFVILQLNRGIRHISLPLLINWDGSSTLRRHRVGITHGSGIRLKSPQWSYGLLRQLHEVRIGGLYTQVRSLGPSVEIQIRGSSVGHYVVIA